ncbi:MAG: hypothetical protein Tsb0013_22300 [Phycisphaerales bacterium]
MAVRQNAALHLAPLTIRVALGLIFLYYGAGKLFYTDFALSIEQEATLVSLGVLEARPGGPQPPAPMDATGDARSVPAFALIRVQDGQEEDPRRGFTEMLDEIEQQAQEQGASDEVQEAIDDIAQQLEGAGDASTDEASGDEAGDTLEPRTVRRVYGLVFAMNGAAQRGHWPDFLSTGAWLERMAWVAGVTEFVGGFFIILGVFTRLWALSMLGTMVVACWLTQISPWLGKPDAFLGFLPPWPMEDVQTWIPAYQTLFFQLIIAAGAKAVLFSGAGAVSVDRLIFGSVKKKPKASEAG